MHDIECDIQYNIEFSPFHYTEYLKVITCVNSSIYTGATANNLSCLALPFHFTMYLSRSWLPQGLLSLACNIEMCYASSSGCLATDSQNTSSRCENGVPISSPSECPKDRTVIAASRLREQKTAESFSYCPLRSSDQLTPIFPLLTGSDELLHETGIYASLYMSPFLTVYCLS